MLNTTKIKLIIWDLDETLWTGTLSDNDTLAIREEFVSFINETLDRGIVHSICTKNELAVTKDFLVSVNLWDLFVFPSISWAPKGERIKNLISDMKLRPENVLFVDDNVSNLQEAAYYCPQLQICTPQELALSIDEIAKCGTVDKSRPRLAQYRLLEEKVKSQQTFASNEEFLLSCDIRVSFHQDCIENIDRIHELIMRSNQLNYTKYRQDKDALLADLTLSTTQAEYITVKDSFGDYGLVGFYMMLDGEIKHFLFSCRTLGMLVEQYVYKTIGCPEIRVVGDVITKLNDRDLPKWINQQNLASSMQRKGTIGEYKVLFKGPCDISQIFSFIEETPLVSSEFTYINGNGISVEGYNHTSQMVTALTAPDADKEILIQDTPWIDKEMLDASAWLSNDVIVYSTLTDGNLGIYQHKQTGWQIALCEKYYDLTDSRNWDNYINKSIFTSFIDFTKESLADFADKYQFVNNEDACVTMRNLDVLYNNKKPDAKLFLILGSEKEYTGETKPSYKNRHLFHAQLNRKIEAWAADKSTVQLINISAYVSTQKDYTDTINHLQKKVYYLMAQDILSVLDEGHTSLKMRGKGHLWKAVIKAKLKQVLRRN